MLQCFRAAGDAASGGGRDWKQRCRMRKVLLAALGVSKISVVSYWPCCVFFVPRHRALLLFSRGDLLLHERASLKSHVEKKDVRSCAISLVILWGLAETTICEHDLMFNIVTVS